MNIELIARENHPEGYYDAVVGDKTYSVVDFGTTMKTHPMPAGIFMGWEAIEIVDGELDSDSLFRSETWEELSEQLV